MRRSRSSLRPARALLTALCASAALAAVPGLAQAATLTVDHGVDNEGDPYHFIWFDGSDISDNLTVTRSGEDLIFDANSAITGACTPLYQGNTKRSCHAPNVSAVFVRPQGGYNEVNVNGSQGVTVTGAGNGVNEFTGGSGPDTLVGGDGDDELEGNGGADTIEGRGGEDRIFGGPGPDALDGEAHDDHLNGGTGADGIEGGGGRDLADYLLSPAGVTVRLDGNANDGTPGEGDNVATDIEDLRGSVHDDLLFGQAGDTVNELTGSDGSDALVGGGGNDSLVGGLDGDDLFGGLGDDGLHGGSGSDLLNGEEGEDDLRGGPDGDTLAGGTSADVMEGGEGSDGVSYIAHTQPVRVDLDAETADDGATGEGDTVEADVERIAGGLASDTLIGNAGANYISGGQGNDDITGGGGQDELKGEADRDTLRASDGAADKVDCGVELDAFDTDPADALVACETDLTPPAAPAKATPRPQPKPPAVGTRKGRGIRITPARLRISRRGVARLRIHCPASAPSPCAGTLRLTRGGKVIGSRRFKVRAGRSKAMRIKVRRSVRRQIVRKRLRLSARATVVTR